MQQNDYCLGLVVLQAFNKGADGLPTEGAAIFVVEMIDWFQYEVIQIEAIALEDL